MSGMRNDILDVPIFLVGLLPFLNSFPESKGGSEFLLIFSTFRGGSYVIKQRQQKMFFWLLGVYFSSPPPCGAAAQHGPWFSLGAGSKTAIKTTNGISNDYLS